MMTTDNEKIREEQIKFLYRQLDTCGQILAEWDEEKPPTYYRREYRKIINTLRKLEPENWDYPCFQKKDYTERNKAVAEWCSRHKCPSCQGELKQSRSGSYRVVCQNCKKKYQLKHG